MLKKFRRKLILSIISSFALLITATSTTYAWFAKNADAWADDFEIEIENIEGLLISINGTNFQSALSKDQVKKAIISKKLGKDINSSELTKERVDEEFEKIYFSAVTTKDLTNFYAIDPGNILDGYYQMKDASIWNYLEFDLWFRIDTSKDVAVEEQILTFANSSGGRSSYIDSIAQSVTLSNSLNAGGTSYNSGEAIAVNPQDAMRIGVKVYNDELTDIVYEPNLGLGSVAIENILEHDGLDDSSKIKYDPEKNAMLTYFNNSNRGKLKPIAYEDKDFFINTEKDFDGSKKLGRFIPNETNTKYSDVKITVYIWLEGYDADYFLGINSEDIKIFLNFTKV